MTKKLFILLLVCVFIMTPISIVKADGLTPPKPLYPPDCGAVANTPYRSGTYVIGSGGLNCAQSQARIDINVEVATNNGGHTYSAKTCYNTRWCTTNVYAYYAPGLTWTTKTSGYAQGWSWYTQSPGQYIP